MRNKGAANVASQPPGGDPEETNTSAKDHPKSARGLDQKLGLEKKNSSWPVNRRNSADLSENERRKENQGENSPRWTGRYLRDRQDPGMAGHSTC